MPHHARRLSHLALATVLAAALGVLAALSLVGEPATGEAAEDDPKVDIVYMFVTGEGPSAKAWFQEAPSTGLAVQDALDRFAKQGYRTKHVTDELRSTSDAVAFAILLERVR